MDVKAIIALVLVGLGVLLDLIGLAIPYWRYYNQDVSGITYRFNYGLWTGCNEIGSSRVCGGFVSDEITGTLQATRALVVMGLLLGIGSLICFLLRLCSMKDKLILNRVAAGLAIAAGIFMLIGTIIYATDSDYKDSDLELHAGFALVIVAGVFEIFGGIVLFFVPAEQ